MKKFTMFYVGIVLLGLILPNIGTGKKEVEKVSNFIPSENQKLECIRKIHEYTRYDENKLNYIGTDKKSIVVTYLNAYGTTHKFKCIDNKVKLWAKGSESWIDM
ncbi:hypothetical protein KW473_11555 [Vibrio fluvialis]|nr:hypothetical protein [Vibrio fluvialis]